MPDWKRNQKERTGEGVKKARGQEVELWKESSGSLGTKTSRVDGDVVGCKNRTTVPSDR